MWDWTRPARPWSDVPGLLLAPRQEGMRVERHGLGQDELGGRAGRVGGAHAPEPEGLVADRVDRDAQGGRSKPDDVAVLDNVRPGVAKSPIGELHPVLQREDDERAR